MRAGLKNQAARVEKLRFRVVVSRTWSGALLAERPDMHKSWAVLVLVVLGGCDLYFGGGDDEPPCYDYGYDDSKPDIAADQLRDPYSGQCSYFGGNYPCDDACGPCPAIGVAPNPDWGSCYSICEGLTESSCKTTTGCYAAYLDDPTADGKRDFYGCWQTAPSGPIHGTCTGNDAYECSRHDDCSAVYSDLTLDAEPAFQFLSCVPESNTYSCEAVLCAPGYHCEEHCYGDPQTNTMDVCQPYCVQDLTCASVDCTPGYTCSEVCETSNGKTTCYPACLPEEACEALQTELACQSRSDCTPVYDGTDCTCTIYGCTCQNLTYERCETL
jgi:hypothetical protein